MKLLPQPVLGIVGSEAAKFTEKTEQAARRLIRKLIVVGGYARVVSGACHLGGIDVWAIEEAEDLRIPTKEFPPARHSWTDGYMLRNKQIAEASSYVVCITVRELPPHYTGMRFKLCYHCGTSDHVKSGGCWTVKYAKQIGKTGQVIIID